MAILEKKKKHFWDKYILKFQNAIYLVLEQDKLHVGILKYVYLKSVFFSKIAISDWLSKCNGNLVEYIRYN